MRSLNLDQLRAFVEVVERGSFTAAAEELNRTQPAVTHPVDEPERRFKVELKGHELV
jgi:DNA-binding transcriptional LysR family regulator